MPFMRLISQSITSCFVSWEIPGNRHTVLWLSLGSGGILVVPSCPLWSLPCMMLLGSSDRILQKGISCCGAHRIEWNIVCGGTFQRMALPLQTGEGTCLSPLCLFNDSAILFFSFFVFVSRATALHLSVNHLVLVSDVSLIVCISNSGYLS